MRRRHILGANKKAETWRYLAFFDTETLPVRLENGAQRQSFRLGWACCTDEQQGTEAWAEFHSGEELVRWLCEQTREKMTRYVFAHNLYFDFKVVGAHTLLPLWGWKMTNMYFAPSGVQAFMEFRHGTKRLVFIDSMNYFGVSLKDLGEKIGVAKQDVDPLTAGEEMLSAYCKQDVVVVQAAITQLVKWVKDNDIGNMQKTLASLAFTSFRHRFMNTPIYIHSHVKALQLERDSYHGGRVEVFYKGRAHGQFYQLDVNSMYAAAMVKENMPHKLVYYTERPVSLAALKKRMDKHYVIARVTLRTDVERYPLVQDNMLIHPVGTFETVLCDKSLRTALALSHIVAVHECAVYEQHPLFTSFVRYFWGQRQTAQQEGKTVESYFFKILMNTLYGKFAQRRVNKVEGECSDPTAFDATNWIVDGLPCTRWRFAGKQTWFLPGRCPRSFCARPGECDKSNCLLYQGTESYHSFPAISSAITDYSRCTLWELIEQAGVGHVYYVDTDCLVVDGSGYTNLENKRGAGLGELKLEAEFEDLEIHAPKDYVFGKKVKHKGVKTKAVYDPATDSFTQDSFEKIRGGLRAGSASGILVKQIVKHLRRELKTRRPGPGGWTRPLVQEGTGHSGV